MYVGNILVKHRYAAERTTGPLSKVCFKLGVDGLQKRSHDRDLEGRSSYGSLLPKVQHCTCISEPLPHQAFDTTYTGHR